MGDRSPPQKPDEQYPLLKVEGGGDISHAVPTHAINPCVPEWGVTCKKNSRFSRWPEFISAVWMTLILCGISFLIFHVLGMGLNRGQQFIIVKCNESKPASNVYYHQIVNHGNNIPFVLYTEYLANMATKYPLLQFNVVFLVDDLFPVVRSIKRNPANYYYWYNSKLDDTGKDAFNEFMKRYQNVNVTVMPLSKFMAKTPLKYKWRVIPQEYLTFYARVYSVWQNGGIGMDLKTFNNDYNNRLFADRRIDTILSQHNDGINTADYTRALNKIDLDESNAICSMFFNVINHFLNHTRSFFNKTLSAPVSYDKAPLLRTHRNKREAADSKIEKAKANYDSKNFYSLDEDLIVASTNNTNTTYDSIDNAKVLVTSTIATEKITNQTNITDVKTNKSDTNEVVLFYDFSIYTPWLSIAAPFSPLLKSKPSPVTKTIPHLLSIDSDGVFIAASLKFHPFLGYLTSAGCFGMHPRIAIRDALATQCSSAFKEDIYCDNIYIL